MGINCSLLHQNNGNLPLPSFVAITQLFFWIIFINDFMCVLTGSPEKYLYMILYVIQTLGVTKVIQILST